MYEKKNVYYFIEIFLIYVIISLAVLIALLPIYWIFQSTFKPSIEQLISPPNWFPKNITLENYTLLFKQTNVIRALFNSSFITITSVLIAIILGAPAAYSIARYNVGGGYIPFFVLMIRMTPAVAFILPLFLIARYFNLKGSYFIIIITYVFFTLPMVIWLMMGFFSELPVELEEAAMIDGCSRIQAMLKITLPLTAPGIASTAIFCSILVWNEFIYALILTGDKTTTLTVLVNSFVTQRGMDYGLMCCVGIIMCLPMIVFGIFMQKHLVKGLIAGAIKG